MPHRVEISQETAKALFDYREGALYWKISIPQCKIYPGKLAGYITQGRWAVKIKSQKYLLHRIIFLWHRGYLPENVDHEDQNPLNNYIDNLRDASYSQNAANRKSQINATSRYLGVFIKKGRTPPMWEVNLAQKDRKGTYVGIYLSEIEAALAYNREAVKYHGEFASLNIIQPESL